MLRREQSRFPGKRKETMLNRNMRNTAILLVVFLAVYMFGNYFAEKNLMSGSGSSSYSYERLESDIAKNKVKSIEVVQNAQVPTGSAIVKLNDGEKKVAHVTDVNKVIDLAQQYKVSCQVDDVKSSDAGWLSMILPWIVIGVIMMFMFGMISRASGGGGGGNKMMNFGKSRAKMQDPESQNIRFDQVAGLQEEKEELKEIVDFLKSPQKYIEVGARIPKGVILVGPPGTGKTLLAKAVSGEAGVPFFSISGSDFVEMFVGVGASRVRDLFEDAKRNAPCIVFIDEIDAVARRRGTGLGGGHDEREQTLNQLLVEMDGFGVNEGIIVMAATNRVDILDPAILRPGRFDRKVAVGRPDVKGREEILKVHVKGKPLAEDVDLHQIARTTPGFSGADLENLMNEAAIHAARNNARFIRMEDIRKSFRSVRVSRCLYGLSEDKNKVFYEDAAGRKTSFEISESDIDTLLSAVRENDREKIEAAAQKVFAGIRNSEMNLEMISASIYHILYRLMEMVKEFDDETNQQEIFEYIGNESFHHLVMMGRPEEITDFFADYAGYFAQVRSQENRNILDKIDAYVKEHYMEKISLRSLGEMFYINNVYLGQLYKKRYHIVFRDYLNQLRLEKAKELLEDTDTRIYRIAEETGFGKADYFINKFVQVYGITPNQYRMKFKKSGRGN